MSWWPPSFFSANTAPPDDLDILPDFYQFLDPAYSNRKRKPVGDLEPEAFRDQEGDVYYSTYRFFPTPVPRNKRPPPEERPAYFQRPWPPGPEEGGSNSQRLHPITIGSVGGSLEANEQTWLFYQSVMERNNQPPPDGMSFTRYGIDF